MSSADLKEMGDVVAADRRMLRLCISTRIGTQPRAENRTTKGFLLSARASKFDPNLPGSAGSGGAAARFENCGAYRGSG
jgi:hypothetical protein